MSHLGSNQGAPVPAGDQALLPTCVARADSPRSRAGRESGRRAATATQQTAFERDGLLRLPGLISIDWAAVLRDKLESMLEPLRTIPRGVHLERGEDGHLRQVYGLHLAEQSFRELASDPRVGQLVGRLLGGRPYVWQSKVNFNDTGSSCWLWHQDHAYWSREGVRPTMASLFVLLDPVSPDDGPTEAVLGSHRLGDVTHSRQNAYGRRQRVANNDAVRSQLAASGTVSFIGEPGDAFLLGCQTVHRSTMSISRRPRRVFIVAYNIVENLPTAPRGRPEWEVAIDTAYPGSGDEGVR